MKYRVIALILAFSFMTWAQTPNPNSNPVPPQGMTQAEKGKCPCCDKMASTNAKDGTGHACCARNSKGVKESASCCSGHDAKCCADAQSCTMTDKGKSCCSAASDKQMAKSCCKEECGKDCCPSKDAKAACCHRERIQS